MFPLVALALMAFGWASAHALLPDRSALERVWLACLLGNALPIVIVSLLSLLGVVGRTPFAALVFVSTVIAVTRIGPRERATMRVDWDIARDVIAAPGTRLVASSLIASLAVGASLLASYTLTPWAWDALGYHLPQSDVALGDGAFGAAPSSVVYVDAYPHLGAAYFTAFRLALGSDRWVESAQLPFALLATLSIAVLARREGVPTRRALALGLLFFALPTVTLQLAANYVDVIFAGLVLASFVLVSGPLEMRAFILAGITLGLVLGTKPVAPIYVAAGLLVLFARALRARRLGEGALTLGLTVAVGAWKYIENIALHGNPVWPVELALGPLLLPGKITTQTLAAVGLHEPMRSANAFERVLISWSTPFPEHVVYDMRVGGLGALFTLGLLPVTLAALLAAGRDEAMQKRLSALRKTVLPIGLATLASPALYWGRYTLALAGALLVVAGLSAELVPRAWRRGIDTWLLALALLSCWTALPGFTAEGPSLVALASMREEARVFGIDEAEPTWRTARENVGPGEAFAYDASLGLPGRAFPAHQQARSVFLGTPSSIDEVLLTLRSIHARAVVLADGPHSLAEQARSRPDVFRDLGLCGAANEAHCAVFLVRFE